MPPARQATVAAAAQLRAQDLFSDGHHSAQTLCQAGEELDYVCHISHDASGSEVARQLCRAASWRTWAIQEFPNDTQMAQDSVREWRASIWFQFPLTLVFLRPSLSNMYSTQHVGYIS